MFRIAKQFAFSASHQLYGLPEGHQCMRLHGHNYLVEVVLASPTLDDRGFVVDYAELDAAVWPFIHDQLDHRHLNDVIDTTTAEVVARSIYDVAASVFGAMVECVRVSETPKTWAEYRGAE